METLFELKIDIHNRQVVLVDGDIEYPVFIPQEGDIIYGKSKTGDESDMIDIIEWYGKDTHSSYLSFNIDEDRVYSGDLETPHENYNYAMATEEQKQMLFDRLKRDGKQWNFEKNIDEDIIEQEDESFISLLKEIFNDLIEYLNRKQNIHS